MQSLEKMGFVVLILITFTNSFQLAAMEKPIAKNIFDCELSHRALHKAAYDGDAKTVDEIIKNAGNRAWELIITPVSNNGDDTDLPKNEYGLTALHWAARQESIDVVNLLLEWAIKNGKFCDLLYQGDQSGRTVLHIAVIYQKAKIVQQLLCLTQVHGDPSVFASITTCVGRTACSFAKDPAMIEIFRSFKQNYDTKDV